MSADENLIAAEIEDELEEELPEKVDYQFDFAIRPALRIGMVEKILGAEGIIQPVPSRQLLIRMIRRGELEGKKIGSGWIIYEDSFKQWVRTLSGAE